MHATTIVQALALAGVVTLAACGGGSGGSALPPPNVTAPLAPSVAPPVTPPVTPVPPPIAPPVTVPPMQAALTFSNASVHDPSVIKAGDTYYVFGSHLAAAKSADLMNWIRVAEGANAANPLFADVTKELAETFAWAQTSTLWAADVVQLDDGKFYFYYNACKGDSPRSALGVAVADQIEGPYVNKQIILKSGMWGQLSDDGKTIYDATRHPNVVDPHTFRDKDNQLWMIYGSYSGGIFILAMDGATGLPKPGQGYGKHLMGGNHARIEGAYVLYHPQSRYYYMFTSFGGLDASGAYNMRVARSLNPDGPYLDAKGTDMATVKSDPALPLFDDASIAPHGQKLMGNHRFELAAGESGTALGYISPGHNSAYYDTATKQSFLIFHTRFPGMGEQHEIRVHEMFINEQGWPVVAPFRYAPLSKSSPLQAVPVSPAEAQGSYKMINHGKDISAAVKTSQNIKLNANGTVSGAVTGKWAHKGANNMSLTLDTGGAYSAVLSRQWNTNAAAFVVTFTAQSGDGVSLWGARTGN